MSSEKIISIPLVPEYSVWGIMSGCFCASGTGVGVGSPRVNRASLFASGSEFLGAYLVLP